MRVAVLPSAARFAGAARFDTPDFGNAVQKGQGRQSCEPDGKAPRTADQPAARAAGHPAPRPDRLRHPSGRRGDHHAGQRQPQRHHGPGSRTHHQPLRVGGTVAPPRQPFRAAPRHASGRLQPQLGGGPVRRGAADRGVQPADRRGGASGGGAQGLGPGGAPCPGPNGHPGLHAAVPHHRRAAGQEADPLGGALAGADRGRQLPLTSERGAPRPSRPSGRWRCARRPPSSRRR